MIGLGTKYISVCMTFKMVHRHDKKIKQKEPIVKVDVTRCGHKKLIN
jgi:hypothetical protein